MEQTNNYEVYLKNKNASNWYEDLTIVKNGEVHKVIGSKIDILANYELTQLIKSYHSYVDYYNMLVTTTSNKPMTLAYLDVFNFENILVDIEKIEKDVLLFKNKILNLENSIKDKILTYLKDEVIILQRKSISRSLLSSIKGIFRVSYKTPLENAIDTTVKNNLVTNQL